jgi:hypothetical protein
VLSMKRNKVWHLRNGRYMPSTPNAGWKIAAHHELNFIRPEPAPSQSKCFIPINTTTYMKGSAGHSSTSMIHCRHTRQFKVTCFQNSSFFHPPLYD